jgi:hypothetical protein
MRRRIVVGLVAATSLACAPTALAVKVQYWAAPLGAGERAASSSYNNFRMSEGYAAAPYYSVDVAAHEPGSWTLHGSWIRGTGYACHWYSGTDYFGALIRNPHSITQTVVGNAYYSSSVVC